MWIIMNTELRTDMDQTQTKLLRTRQAITMVEVIQSIRQALRLMSIFLTPIWIRINFLQSVSLLEKIGKR